MQKKDKNVAALLALFTGGLGLQWVYLGKPGNTIVSFLFCWTTIPAWIGLYHAIKFAFMKEAEFDAEWNPKEEKEKEKQK